MNVNLDKLLTDYKTDDLANILIDDVSILTNNTNNTNKYKKIYVYNKKNNSPLQKIWIRAPKMKVVRETISLKTISLINNYVPHCIPLQLLLLDNSFKKFINKLEKKLYIHLNKKFNKKFNKNLKIISIIKESDDFPTLLTINMPITQQVTQLTNSQQVTQTKINDCLEFDFNIYNEQNEKVTINKISNDLYISSIIELSEIWINTLDGKFGFNWNVLQLKTHLEVDFSKCMFIDENISKSNLMNSNNIHNIVPPSTIPPLISPQVSSHIQTPNVTSLMPKPFIPTMSDLLNIKLKPVIRDNTVFNNKQDNNINLQQVKDNLKKIDNNLNDNIKIIDKKKLKYLTNMIDNIIADMEKNTIHINNIEYYEDIVKLC
jgi:hypothetical protein